MIQRPQTLLLLASAGVVIATLFMPFWEVQGIAKTVVLDAFAITTVSVTGEVIASEPLFYMLLLPVVSVLVAFFTIFKYNNRVLQAKLCSLNNLIILGYFAMYLLWGTEKAKAVVDFQGTATYLFGVYLPIGAFLLTLAAKWLINKDEKLVRSNDRIR